MSLAHRLYPRWCYTLFTIYIGARGVDGSTKPILQTGQGEGSGSNND